MPYRPKKKYKKPQSKFGCPKSEKTGEDIDMLHERELDPEAGEGGSRSYLDHIDGA